MERSVSPALIGLLGSIAKFEWAEAKEGVVGAFAWSF